MPPLNEALRLLDGLYGERTVKRRIDEEDGVDEGLNAAKATRTSFGELDHAVRPSAIALLSRVWMARTTPCQCRLIMYATSMTG